MCFGIEPIVIRCWLQDHDHPFFILWFVKVPHQRVRVGIGCEQSEAVDVLPLRRAPFCPQTGHTQGLAIEPANGRMHRFAAAPIWLKKRLQGNDAMLGLPACIAKTGFLGHGF